MDNLNFIKIYFRVFTHKIIILKKLKLSIKVMKNHRRRMKTHLSTRTGQKTLEEESKQHPNTKECLVPKGQFGTLKGPNFPLLGFGPTAFG